MIYGSKSGKMCAEPLQGKIVDPYVSMSFSEWVTAVPVTEDGKIVMVRQYRHALGEECIEFPGGCVDATDGDFRLGHEKRTNGGDGLLLQFVQTLGIISCQPLHQQQSHAYVPGHWR
mgnify:CR=1 FL=1